MESGERVLSLRKASSFTSTLWTLLLLLLLRHIFFFFVETRDFSHCLADRVSSRALISTGLREDRNGRTEGEVSEVSIRDATAASSWKTALMRHPTSLLTCCSLSVSQSTTIQTERERESIGRTIKRKTLANIEPCKCCARETLVSRRGLLFLLYYGGVTIVTFAGASSSLVQACTLTSIPRAYRPCPLAKLPAPDSYIAVSEHSNGPEALR